mgnify:CR=1 FL=1
MVFLNQYLNVLRKIHDLQHPIIENCLISFHEYIGLHKSIACHKLIFGNAKKNVVKSIYTKTVKFIQSESTLCSLGSNTTVMSGCLKCSDISSGGAVKLIVCMENISKDINPFSNPDWAAHQKTAVRSGRDTSNDALGKVLINTANSSTAVYISACFETPCSSSSNTLSTTININP